MRFRLILALLSIIAVGSAAAWPVHAVILNENQNTLKNIVSASPPLIVNQVTGQISLAGPSGQVLTGNGINSVFSANPFLGTVGTVGGSLSLAGQISGLAQIAPAAAGSNILFQLPPSNGLNNYVLTTDGAGHTTWAAPIGTSGGSLVIGGQNAQVQFNNAGALGAESSFKYTGNGALSLGSANVASGSLAFIGTTSGTVTVKPQNVTGTYNFVLPSSIGTAGMALISGGTAAPQAYGLIGLSGGGTNATTATGALANFGIVNNPTYTIPQNGYRPEGDDLSAVSDSGGATVRFPYVLAANLGGNVTTNYAINGAQACDVVDQQTIKKENPGASGNPLYTMTVGEADAFYSGGVANYLANVFRPCLQSSLIWLSVPSTNKFLIQASPSGNCTLTGSWGTNNSGNPGRWPLFPSTIFSNSAGATASCPFTTTIAGTVNILYGIADGIAGQATLQIDGGSPFTINGNTNPVISTHLSGLNQGHGVAVQPFAGISPGSHTMLLTMLAGSGSFPYIAPFAITTPLASIGTTAPRVFVAGVPYQQNDANSTVTAAYNTEVQSSVTTLAAEGLPVYFMDTRSVVDSTTNMATAQFLNNLGQTNTVSGFFNLISTTITGGTVTSAVSSASGGFGLNASTATGAVSFTNGTAQIGILPQSAGGTGATTGQGVINNINTSPVGSAGYPVVQCTGSHDETAFAVAALAAYAARQPSSLIPEMTSTGIQCTIDGQYQVPTSLPYVHFFSQPSPHGLTTPVYTSTPSNYVFVHNNNVKNATASKCAFDANGTISLGFTNTFLVGDNGGAESVMICNSHAVRWSGPISGSYIDMNFSAISNVNVGIGCPVDPATGNCDSTSGLGGTNWEGRLYMSGMGNINSVAMNGNPCDLMIEGGEYGGIGGFIQASCGGIKINGIRMEAAQGGVNAELDFSAGTFEFVFTGNQITFFVGVSGKPIFLFGDANGGNPNGSHDIVISGNTMTGFVGGVDSVFKFIGTGSKNKSYVISGNSIDATNASYYMHFAGTTTDQVISSGNSVRGYGTAPFFFDTETPPHLVERDVGPPEIMMGQTSSIGTTSPNVNDALDLSNNHTKALGLPVGTTGQRPTPSEGMVRDNTTLHAIEAYINGAWSAIGASGALTPTSVAATGPITVGTQSPVIIGSTFPTNYSLGPIVYETLNDGTTTISNPTNPTWGILTYALKQGTGNNLVSWGGAFDMGASGGPTLSTTINKVDYVKFQYDPNLAKWVYLGIGLGY